MSPRCECATSQNRRRQRARGALPFPKPRLPWLTDTEDLSQGKKKPTKPTALRRSARLQTNGSPEPPTVSSLPPEPLEDSSITPQVLSRRQKRKQPQTDIQSMSQPIPGRSLKTPLSKRNLQAHNRQLLGSEELGKMESESEPSRRGGGRGGKRTLSQHSGTTAMNTNQETASAHSQRSSGTSAHYRWVTLQSARVYIRSRPPPEDIQTQISTIIQSEKSAERKEELLRLTRELCDSFAEVISKAAGEEDCLAPLHNALSSMGYYKSLTFPRKAGMYSPTNQYITVLTLSLDWQLSIKPYPSQPSWDMSFIDKIKDAQLRKRQQVGNFPFPSHISSPATTNDMNSQNRVRFFMCI
jgi:hypothetical protein